MEPILLPSKLISFNEFKIELRELRQAFFDIHERIATPIFWFALSWMLIDRHHFWLGTLQIWSQFFFGVHANAFRIEIFEPDLFVFIVMTVCSALITIMITVISLWVPTWDESTMAFPYWKFVNRGVTKLFRTRFLHDLYEHRYKTTLLLFWTMFLYFWFATFSYRIGLSGRWDSSSEFDIYNFILSTGSTYLTSTLDFILKGFNFSFLYIYIVFYMLLFSSPIHILLSLIFIFFHGIIFLFWADVEFFSIVLLIVYVGAISILFLFVIMLLNIKNESVFESKFFHLLAVIVIVAIFNNPTFFHNTNDAVSNLISNNAIVTPEINNEVYLNYFYQNSVYFIHDMFILNNSLYTQYAVLFILSAVILLVTMVGSIALLLS